MKTPFLSRDISDASALSIIVDDREKALAPSCYALIGSVTKKRLRVGDVLLLNGSIVRAVFENKSFYDYVVSYSSGRLQSQLSRLAKLKSCFRFLLIYEANQLSASRGRALYSRRFEERARSYLCGISKAFPMITVELLSNRKEVISYVQAIYQNIMKQKQ